MEIKGIDKKDRMIGKALQAFLFNRRTLLVFSFIISLSMWTLVKTNATMETTKVFSDIPITIRAEDIYENFGLEKIAVTGPPSAINETVSVTATASAYHLSQIDIQSGDITVVATQLGSVTQPGQINLALSVFCTNPNVRVSIPSSQRYIIVWFDRIKEVDFPIDRVAAVGVSVAPESGLLIGEAFSPIKSVTLRGPETEMNAISSVELSTDVGRELDATETFPASLILRDTDDNQLDFLGDGSYISVIAYNDLDDLTSKDELVITVPINKTAELPVAVAFKKAPSSFSSETLKYTITPPILKLEGQSDAINKLAEAGKYELDEKIDLSALSIYNSVQTLKLNLSSGISDTGGLTEVTVAFDLTGYSEKLLNPIRGVTTEFRFAHLPQDMKASILTDSLENVLITGPAASLQNLWEYGCVVEVDMSAADASSGQKLVPATVIFPEFPSCWAVGTYQVRVEVG